MNRPACLRHIVAHVANRRVTGYRLRTPDAEALARYVEHLEANQRGQAQTVPAPALATCCAHPDVVAPAREHHAGCMIREAEPLHAGPCPLAMTQRTKAA